MGGKCVKSSKAGCAKKLFNARWETSPVKCGDPARMAADGEGLTAGGPATFTIKKTSDGGTAATANSSAAPSSVSGAWVSKKPDATWSGSGELKFTVVADGLTAASKDPHLAFHKYPDIAQASLSRELQSPVAPAEARYKWTERVFIELTDRKLILTVKVRLKNRSESRPERGKKESYGDYVARCESVPLGGAIPEAAKQGIKSAVEGVYKEKWDAHRKDCGRGAACDCDRAKKCCKFEIAVVLEFTDTAGAMVTDVNLWPGTGRADSANWYRTESRPGKSWAHEVGHLMGFYDEYAEGATGNSPWQPNVPASIMGSGTSILIYHLEEFRAWLSTQEGEQFDLIRH